MPPSDQEPLINKNEALQDYYATLESRIGYRLVLGGTRHFGYYKTDRYWPFPINGALRAMEDHLIQTLGLLKGSRILDAGCGVGHVAIHLAKMGFEVQGIDVVDRHIQKATRNIKASGVSDKISLAKMDYHHLDGLADGSFDGAYTMETFVHATEPDVAAAEFFRVLRPGGSLALYEYDHGDWDTASKEAVERWTTINKYAAMPSNQKFQTGVLEGILEAAGFEEVVVKDLSANVLPMLRLFFLLAYIPYLFVRFFGLEKYFVNTVAGVEGYRHRDVARYIAVSAKKPSDGGKAAGEGSKIK